MSIPWRRNYRGDVPQYGRAPVLERRQWAREAPKQAAATVSWMLRGERITVEARVVDLGRGGAGVLIPRLPPRGALLRLGLVADPSAGVDGHVVRVSPHPNPGWVFLHIQFERECPEDLLERALGSEPGGAAMDEEYGMS